MSTLHQSIILLLHKEILINELLLVEKIAILLQNKEKFIILLFVEWYEISLSVIFFFSITRIFQDQKIEADKDVV